ncbi:aspartate carbamoyltransferase catalytic subunit [Pseudooceanicola onchidii]|uniref:aspartate carbamoyltransferase catalytic subunit n=1 Tax=Pseudooceanicola onchidii TaxID=2562279 RepID=UPI0010AB3257|nr:aspartate carbamoyltransferase catalytic subunit [Pseudooceanicola onchidii]
MSGRNHAATGEGWDGVLAPGEEILWQGRPDAAFVIGVAQIGGALFGLFFAGFAAVWMMMASMAGGYFWSFGLIHFSVGISLAFGAFFWGPWRRRHTWYTLTDRRAFIATDMPLAGRRLRSWQIDGDSVLEFKADNLVTINFAKEYRQTKNGTRAVDIGFERLEDGHEVYRLMTNVRDRRLADQQAKGTA